jgi:EAL domain-containing protein (putative c-di-GMP-specific phosphodiesterase class I)
VSSIYGMAHACGKETIAEFVERHEKAALLQEKGVDFGLGH